MVANHVLWRWGLRDVLPGYYIQRIPVTECGEPLEPILAVPGRLLLDPRLHTWPGVRSRVRCARLPSCY